MPQWILFHSLACTSVSHTCYQNLVHQFHTHSTKIFCIGLTLILPKSCTSVLHTCFQNLVHQFHTHSTKLSVHFYDYVMDQWKPDKFRIPRFASEYGIQAWCNYETLLGVFEDSDMAYCSHQADHRQHHLGGRVPALCCHAVLGHVLCWSRGVCVCVCVCVCERERESGGVCVCVCVCV